PSRRVRGQKMLHLDQFRRATDRIHRLDPQALVHARILAPRGIDDNRCHPPAPDLLPAAVDDLGTCRPLSPGAWRRSACRGRGVSRTRQDMLLRRVTLCRGLITTPHTHTPAWHASELRQVVKERHAELPSCVRDRYDFLVSASEPAPVIDHGCVRVANE